MNNQNHFAEILQAGSNGAVVQLPGRKFPGVVIQGDSLSIMVRSLIEIRKAVAENKVNEDVVIELDELIDQLYGRVALYEMTLENNGIELPYSKWNQ